MDGIYSPFNLYIPARLSKAIDGQGKVNWVVEGPLSNPEPDLEGDVIDSDGLMKGMETFHKLNGPVDWDHKYAKYGEPKWLIGKGIETFTAPHPRTNHQVPWLRTRLLEDKEIARQAIDHLEKGGDLGYSIYGGIVSRKDNGKINPIVSMVSLTPIPVVAENSGCVRLAKAIAAYEEMTLDALRELRELDLPRVPELWDPSLLPGVERMVKAMEVTGSLPPIGPGADALRVEDLGGDLKVEDDKKKKKKGARARSEDGDMQLIKKAMSLTLAAMLREQRERTNA